MHGRVSGNAVTCVQYTAGAIADVLDKGAGMWMMTALQGRVDLAC